MGNPGGTPINQSQYIGYRVFLHRLNLDSSFPIGEGQTLSINEIIHMDFADPRYNIVSDAINKQAAFQAFLDEVYSQIQEGMQDEDALANGSGIFQTIDITPLVESVSATFNIESEPTCSLTLVDLSFQDFGDRDIATWSSTFPQGQKGDSKSFANSKEDILKGLKNLVIREFDLIRVLGYSKIGHDQPGNPNIPVADLPSRVDWFTNLKLDTAYAMTPQFTGVVATVTRTASVGSVPSTVVSCVGMSRVFTQSVVVASEAIANVFAVEGDPNLSIMKDMTIFGNAFQEKSSEEVFTTIISDYFHPKWIVEKVGPKSKSSEKTLGIPSLDGGYWNDVTVNKQYPENSSIIPFIPLVSLYHIMKWLRAEPIVVMDDKVDGARNFVSQVKGMATPGNDKRDSGSYATFLTPYLTMLRDSYSIFDASYMSPANVFQEIRQKTFYEIFEDRAGTMHMRFPRYNSRVVRHRCVPENTISASWVKDDSAVFNVTLSQNMMAYYGKMDGIAGNPYMDRLSILKFGIRAPEIEENANAADYNFSKALSRFMRDYHASRASRRAQIRRLVDLSINVGDQVLFEVGPVDKISGPDMTWIGGEEELYVGYVTELSETVTISGGSEQTLNLSFVRPVNSTITNSSVFDELALGTNELANALNVVAVGPVAATTNNPNEVVKNIGGIISAYRDEKTSSSKEYFSKTLVSANDGKTAFISFKPVADPIELAIIAAPIVKSNANRSAALQNPGSGPRIVELENSIYSTNQAIDREAAKLGSLVVFGNACGRISSKMLNSPTDIGKGISTTPSDIARVYQIFRRYVSESLAAEVGSSMKTLISFEFPGDVQRYRETQADMSGSGVNDRFVIYHGSILFFDKSSQEFYSEYKRLFSGDASEQFTESDVRSANYVMKRIREDILPLLKSMYSKKRLENNQGVQDLIMSLKDIQQQLSEEQKGQTALNNLTEYGRQFTVWNPAPAGIPFTVNISSSTVVNSKTPQG